MRRDVIVPTALLLGILTTCLSAGSTQATPATAGLKALVVVHLRDPDFTLTESKYRVLWAQVAVKKIPIQDYDFKVAFTEELLNALADDARAEWTASTGQEGIDVRALWDKKATAPASLDADRLLLVDIIQYGAMVADVAADKFTLSVRMRLTDKTGSKKLWEKRWLERVDLPGKVAALQADNQKGLKAGINTLVERICQKIRLEIEKVRM